jgi:hypothetical protein
MQVNILSSQLCVVASTFQGFKSYEIVGNEFGGESKEVTPSGRSISRAIIGVPWTIGRTSDRKKASAYIRQCKAAGQIVTVDLPESARGLASA